MNYEIKIGHLFPEILNMYGDKGNIAALKSRMVWRGYSADVKEIAVEDNFDFNDFDILILGGGSERDEGIACKKLMEKKNELKAYIENGGVMLALCGAYPMLGNYYKIKDEKKDGLGVLDIETDYDERFIGNIVIETEITGEKLLVTGFENHAARTDIKSHTPFGKVIVGNGNNGKDKTCGVVYKNLIATYIHGPLLPVNHKLCDYILKKAIEKKYNLVPEFSPLCDTLENEAHDASVKRFCEV